MVLSRQKTHARELVQHEGDGVRGEGKAGGEEVEADTDDAQGWKIEQRKGSMAAEGLACSGLCPANTHRRAIERRIKA